MVPGKGSAGKFHLEADFFQRCAKTWDGMARDPKHHKSITLANITTINFYPLEYDPFQKPSASGPSVEYAATRSTTSLDSGSLV